MSRTNFNQFIYKTVKAAREEMNRHIIFGEEMGKYENKTI